MIFNPTEGGDMRTIKRLEILDPSPSAISSGLLQLVSLYLHTSPVWLWRIPHPQLPLDSLERLPNEADVMLNAHCPFKLLRWLGGLDSL